MADTDKAFLFAPDLSSQIHNKGEFLNWGSGEDFFQCPKCASSALHWSYKAYVA